MSRPKPDTKQIVVVGAGLAGTAMAAFLAHQSVSVLVFDERTGPSHHPRARLVSARSMELLRELGLAGRVTIAGRPGPINFVVLDRLIDAGAESEEHDDTAPKSPLGAAQCDQDLMEGILREYAIARGARFAYDMRIDRLNSDPTAVTLFPGVGQSVLTASYVILAEGSSARLRDQLGIGVDRRGDLPAVSDLLFRSPQLDTLMATRPGGAFLCRASGTMVFRRDAQRWQISRPGGALRDVEAAVHQAVGARVDVEPLATSSWHVGATLAKSFRAGRVFIIGDAAHTMPPSLGLGGNAGIADAHNLAWKLARVLRKDAGPRLLDSYDPERRAAADQLLEQSMAALTNAATLDRPTLHLGIGYPPEHSAALIADHRLGQVPGSSLDQPRIGFRVPHRWLPDGTSTLDLTGGRTFAALHSRKALDLDIPAARVHFGRDDGVWLIRPDGHVAAHVMPDQLTAAARRILDLR